jgi:hypothetical protein
MVATGLIMSALFIAMPACSSGSSGSGASGTGDTLVGEWAGKCNAKNQDSSQASGEVDATLRFGQDGKYSQTIAGPDGGQVDGTYTDIGQAVELKAQGTSLKAEYAIKDGVLTTKTQDSSGGTPVTSTCTLRRNSGG